MARPQRVSEAEILEAARATFLADGAQAPLAAVAKKLGVSAAALIHRAGSKEALLTRALDEPLGALMQAFDGPPSRAALERLLLTLSAFLSRQIPNIVVLRQAGVALKQTGPAPTVMLRKALRQWLASVPLRVSAEVAAESLLGALEARAFNRYLGGVGFAPGDDKAFLRKLIDGLLEGES